MKTQNLGDELMEAANAMLAHHRGEATYPTVIYHVPQEVDVKSLRQKLQLTQAQFAAFIGSSVHAVRHWENGRRKPEGTARVLLTVLGHNPNAVLDALAT